MAADDLATEWHLTPNGWVRGTARFFGNVQGDEVAPPADRVLTVVHRIYQRSEYSSEERSVSPEWVSNALPSDVIDELHRRYPEPFSRR